MVLSCGWYMVLKFKDSAAKIALTITLVNNKILYHKYLQNAKKQLKSARKSPESARNEKWQFWMDWVAREEFRSFCRVYAH